MQVAKDLVEKKKGAQGRKKRVNKRLKLTNVHLEGIDLRADI